MNLGKPLLEELFNKQIRFKIPVFQRHYVWGEQGQWQPLWNDFVNKFNERLNKQKIHAHYTGSIVLFHENTTTSTLSTYSVIDGQQRLTTFQLFIAAFREVCRKHVDDDSLVNELDKLLFNDKSFGDTNYDNQKFKLEPTKFNSEIFKQILSSTYDNIDDDLIKPVLKEYGVGPRSYRSVAVSRSKILGAYIYFYDQLTEFIKNSGQDLQELITCALLVLKRDFQFVEIGLTQNDDPQMIFETMNGRGASLTETDLIRNYIFMRANSNHEDLDRIYDAYWDEFDDPKSDYKWHEKTSRGRYFESRLQFFVIDYLTLKLQSDVRYDQVFYNYKSYVINQANFASVEDELKELNRFSKIYKRLTKPSGVTAFDKLAKRLLDMDITTIYPLILYIDSDSAIPESEKEKVYEILDSYITRRFLCGFETKNYNNVFLEFLKFFTSNKCVEDFKVLLLSKSSDTNLWPSDLILKDKILNRPLYKEERNKSKSISNILLEIEHSKRGKKQEDVTFSNTSLTIEHVLPQKWFEHWPLDGDTISEDDFNLAEHAVMTEVDQNGKYHKISNRNRVLHSFGNLTILTSSLNPAVSNSSFNVKKAEIANQSTLVLNTYFNSKSDWNEAEIFTRGKSLYDTICKIWMHQ
jgi:uncharacterized protein with ParB-like and HNH nuclease domain